MDYQKSTDRNRDGKSDQPTGHPLAFVFFIWGEFAERCSYYGMRAILTLYMTDRLGVDKGDAASYMAVFIAACYFFPLIGGWVADNVLGKYWTIVLFSVPYVVAQFLVGIENTYLVAGSLVLLAMGSGVIKPNISTLMGITYDQKRPGQTQLRTSAFSWFYMSINFGAGISQLAMPWLRTRYGYQVAFMFPAGLMSMALLIFAIGKRYYARETITRKRVLKDGESLPSEQRTITGIPLKYERVTKEQKTADRQAKLTTLGRIGALFLTVMAFWAIFDQSASTWIFFADTYMNCTLFGLSAPADAIQAFNAWFIVLLVPVSVLIFKVYPMKATSKIALGFLLTAVSMLIMSLAGLLAGTAQKSIRLTVPEGSIVLSMPEAALDKITPGKTRFGTVEIESDDLAFNKKNKKLELKNGTVRLADGTILTIANGRIGNSFPTRLESTGVLESLPKVDPPAAPSNGEVQPATIESIDWVKPSERVTVWWQVLAYLILTVAEILVSITGLELAFVAAPASMKSFVTACWLGVVFLANLLINAPLTQLYPKMPPDVYFAVLAGGMFLVLLIYFPIAIRFNRGMAARQAEEAKNV